MSDSPTSDRVINEGRLVWEVPCEHARWGRHIIDPDPVGSEWCSGGTRHVVDPRRYRIDPVVKRIIDRANALALEGSEV